MSTLLVTSGFVGVTTAVAAGISRSMVPSAAHLGLLTACSTCKLARTTIFIVTATDIKGHCNNIHKGKVRVGVWVGKCSGEKMADARTGWYSMPRIFIEEVPKAQQ